jgi:hypothetical protein
MTESWCNGSRSDTTPSTSQQPFTLDPAAFERRLENLEARAALQADGIPTFDALVREYTAGPDAMRSFAGSGPLLTDDRPLRNRQLLVRGTADCRTTRQLERPWIGQETVKLRRVRTERLTPASDVDRETLGRDLLRAHERPMAWCVLDRASEEAAALVDLLVPSWGPGLCYLAGPWANATRPAVLPQSAASRILRASRTRLWASASDDPDRNRVMESLEHGCLPLQVIQVARGEHEGLSDASRALLLRANGSGSIPPLTDEELKSRLDTVAAALSAGSLERALA